METITLDDVKQAVLDCMRAAENAGDMEGKLAPLSNGFYRLHIIPATQIAAVLASYEDWKSNVFSGNAHVPENIIGVIGTAVHLSGTEY